METLNQPAFILDLAGQSFSLLAPRGVTYSKGVLAVSDTGQNRVFIWKNDSHKKNGTPDIVLGQPDLHEAGRNSGTSVSASSLQYPSGIWTDGEKLIVGDAWNHRVLIWHQLPERDGQPADVILGQPSGEENLPNTKGPEAHPTSRTLYWPYGVCSDGESLWIADTGNRRVLYYEKIPHENFSPADGVIGQNSFEERDYDNQNAIWPYSVHLGPAGQICIADTQYFRVLVWKNKKDAFVKQADLLFGQPDFNANGQNQFRYTPTAHTLNWCYDACFDQEGLWVADTGNSRILHWKSLPEVNGAPAEDLIGQLHFEAHGEANLRMGHEVGNEMYWPFSVTLSDDHLIVADTGNHRILFYPLNQFS
mgnify:CR=1 FL=1